MPKNGFTNVPVYSTKYSTCFWCFHYRINKIRHSPNLAPLFSDCESSTHTHTNAFYNVNTIQDLGKKKKKGKWKDRQHKYNHLNYPQLYSQRMNHIHSTNIVYKNKLHRFFKKQTQVWKKSSSLLWLWSTMFSQCVRICMHDCVRVFKLNAVKFHISVHLHLNLPFLTARINMNAWISTVKLSLQRGIFLLPFVRLHNPTGKKQLINTHKLTELCCSWTRGFSCLLSLNRAATVTSGWRAPFLFFFFFFLNKC